MKTRQPIPANLTGKEFDYWCQAQDALQEVKDTRYLAFCASVFCLGVGIFLGQLIAI